MPRITEETRQVRRAAILDAAATLFAQHGFAETSMADIIEAADSSAGAVYGHFKNKSELISAAASDVLARRTVELEDALASGHALSPAQLVRRFLDESRQELASPALLMHVWATASSTPEVKDIVNAVGSEVLGLFAAHLTAWHRSRGLDPDAAAAAGRAQASVCLGVCQGYMAQWALLSAFDGDAYLEAAAALLPD